MPFAGRHRSSRCESELRNKLSRSCAILPKAGRLSSIFAGCKPLLPDWEIGCQLKIKTHHFHGVHSEASPPQNRYRCSTRVLTRHIALATCPGYRYTSTEHEVLNCGIVRCVEVTTGFPPKLRIRHPKRNGWLSKPQGSTYWSRADSFKRAARSGYGGSKGRTFRPCSFRCRESRVSHPRSRDD